MKQFTFDGDNYQIGLQLGQLGKAAWHQQICATALWRKTAERKSSVLALEMQQRVAQRFPLLWQELQGLAAGLEAPFDAVFAWNCRGDLLPSTSDGCTTVSGFTAEGVPVVAHNEDGFPQLADACALVNIRPDGGMPFTSFYYPGSLCGHTFSVNACGLVNTVNNIRASLRPAGLPRQILARAALDAHTLDEAIAILIQEPRSGAFHHTLAQCGDGRIISVEATGSGSHVSVTDKRYGHANHLIHPSLAHVAQTVTDSSASRQRRLQQWLEQTGACSLDPAQALAILNDQHCAELPILRQDPDDPDDENTLATAVYVIEPGGVRWSIFTADRQTAAVSGSLTT